LLRAKRNDTLGREIAWPLAASSGTVLVRSRGAPSMLPPVFGVLFDGLAYGMLLFLLSVGQSVTLGMMNFINLAHCSFAMLGGYVTVALMKRLGLPFSASRW